MERAVYETVQIPDVKALADRLAEAFAEARSPRNNYAKWKRAKQLDNSTA